MLNTEMKQILLNLLKDISDDTILAKYAESNGVWNVRRMKEDLINNGEYSKQYFSDLSRCSRDILQRQANK